MSLNTVYIVQNNTNLHKLGTINNDDSREVRLISSLVDTVNYFNEQIFSFIKQDDGIDTDVLHFINSGDINGVIFNIMRWRQCTAYLVIQKSSNSVRYLCYIYDKIKHNGQCFGTTCEMAAQDLPKIKSCFLENRAILLKKLENNINLPVFEQHIKNMETEIETCFGI